MENQRKLNGRPKLTEGKRTRFINVRFTEKEFLTVCELEKESGICRTALIRLRVLSDAKRMLINSAEMIRTLDAIGGEIGRVGNNINQLARHANLLKQQGSLDPEVVGQFDELFGEYLRTQMQLEATLRKVIREMGH